MTVCRCHAPSASCPQRKQNEPGPLPAYLHHLKLLEPLLDQLLDPAGIIYRSIFSKGISGPSLRIFAEIVGAKLFALAQKLSILERSAELVSHRSRALACLLFHDCKKRKPCCSFSRPPPPRQMRSSDEAPSSLPFAQWNRSDSPVIASAAVSRPVMCQPKTLYAGALARLLPLAEVCRVSNSHH